MKKKSSPVYFKSTSLSIDASNGVIKDVVIIQSGKDKYGDMFDKRFLEQIVEQGNSQKQGVKSRFGHPNMCDTTLGSYLGRFKNFRVGTNGEKDVVLADLELDTVSKSSPKGDLFSYVISMTEKNSDMFGNSIVYEPGDKELIKEQAESGAEVLVPYERLKSFIASDLVDSPAATTSLFKDDTDFAAIATEFLEENPKIYDLVSKHPNVLKEFLNKYELNKKENTEMEQKSFLTKIKETIAEAFANEKPKEEKTETTKEVVKSAYTTQDGKTINVEGGLQEGSMVTDDAGNPTPNANYTLNDGTVITTDGDSKISKVTAAESKTEEPSKEMKELQQENENLKAELEALKKSKETEEEEILSEVNKMKEELISLKAQIKSNHTVKTGGNNLRKSDPSAKENRIKSLKEEMKKKKEKATEQV